MKALHVPSHGTDSNDIELHLLEKEVPSIQQGECLIKVMSSAINPSDALALTGYFKHAALPRIPGRDFAGTVVEGPAALIGKNVWGTGGDAGIGFDGTQAAYIKLKHTEIAEIPNNMDVLVAGAQTLPYITAYHALVDRARIRASDSVLVVGALGQVGRAAMSIINWKKCQAIALIRGQAELEMATALGWTAINSEDPHLADKLRLANHGNPITVILNSVGNLYWDSFLSVLDDYGRIVTISARENTREAMINLFELYRANQEIIGINTVTLGFAESARILNALKSGFESGHLNPLVVDEAAVYPPEKAILAYQQVLRGTDKRVLIRF